MVLTEEETKKFGQRIVLDSYFGYKPFEKTADLHFNIYYDNGSGELSSPLDASVDELASSVTEKCYEKNEHLFELNRKEYLLCSNAKGLPLVDPKRRKLLVKDLYAFGIALYVPVFMTFDDGYYFLNELNFTKVEKSQFPEILFDKYQEFEQFLLDNAYGKHYQEFQEKERVYREALRIMDGYPCDFDKKK